MVAFLTDVFVGPADVDVAVVVKDGRLAGIFTMTDAFRGFAEFLRTQFPSSAGGDEAA